MFISFVGLWHFITALLTKGPVGECMRPKPVGIELRDDGGMQFNAIMKCKNGGEATYNLIYGNSGMRERRKR